MSFYLLYITLHNVVILVIPLQPIAPNWHWSELFQLN